VRHVTLSDFSAASDGGASARQGIDEALQEAGVRSIATGGGVSTQRAPFAQDAIEATPGEAVIIDGLVGQINGRPVYAHDILDPISDLLLQEARRAPSKERFEQQAMQIIAEQVRMYVINEIILAEARASLTSQEKQGLLAMMDRRREELIGELGGTLTRAEQSLQESEGRSLDEVIDQEEQMLIARRLLSEEVNARVFVSWRDIERLYDHRRDEFNPTPTVTLGRIRIRTEDHAQEIATIDARLTGGDAFSDVAIAAGMEDGGTWETLAIGPGGISDVELAEFYKPHLADLLEGQTSDAFQRGQFTIWVSVLNVATRESRSIFDPSVQRALKNELRSIRFKEEQSRFIRRITDDATNRHIHQIIARISAIALAQYAPDA